MFKCSACGKDLEAAVNILGEREVVEAHIRAHQREDLPVVREEIENAWFVARAELAEAQEGGVLHHSLSILTAQCKRALDTINRVVDLGKSITFKQE